MNTVNGIFMSLALLFGGGYALEKISVAVKRAALEHIQKGMPSLTDYTSKLTCSKISMSGKLVPAKCGRHR